MLVPLKPEADGQNTKDTRNPGPGQSSPGGPGRFKVSGTTNFKLKGGCYTGRRLLVDIRLGLQGCQ